MVRFALFRFILSLFSEHLCECVFVCMCGGNVSWQWTLGMRNIYLLFAVQMEDLPTTFVVTLTHEMIGRKTRRVKTKRWKKKVAKQSSAPGQRKLAISRWMRTMDWHTRTDRVCWCIPNALHMWMWMRNDIDLVLYVFNRAYCDLMTTFFSVFSSPVLVSTSFLYQAGFFLLSFLHIRHNGLSVPFVHWIYNK